MSRKLDSQKSSAERTAGRVGEISAIMEMGTGGDRIYNKRASNPG